MKSSTHSWLYIAQENQVQLNFLFSFFSLNYSTNGKEKWKKKKKKKKHIFFLFGYETGKCNTKKVWRQCTHSQSKKLDLIVLLNVSLPQSKNKAFFFFFHHIFFFHVTKQSVKDWSNLDFFISSIMSSHKS